MIPVLVLLAGCGPKSTNSVPQSMTLSPSANVHLRNSFDTDPSSYLGRFVPDGAAHLDETSAMSLTCSQHISYRRVEGGGVRYNELLEISSAASARLGIPVVASGSGSASSDRVIRVSYELTGKFIGEVTDHAAFESCCKASPDQCTRRYIGEFIEGTGAIYHQVANSAQGQGAGTDPSSGINGEFEFSHGVQWQRGVEFPNPVFFAFKVSETPYTQQSASACSSFMTTLPPADDDGIYLLAANASPAKDEASARRKAMRNATLEAYRSLGLSVDSTATSLTPPELQTREWCVEKVNTDKGERYVAKALVYAPRPPDPPPAAVLPPATLPAPNAMNTPTVAVDPGGFGSAPAAIVPAPQPTIAAQGAPMPAATFGVLLGQVQSATFTDDKMRHIQAAAAGGHTFTVAQVAQLLPALSMDDDKVEVVAILRPRISDPQNGWMLANQITFSQNKQRVQALFQ